MKSGVRKGQRNGIDSRGFGGGGGWRHYGSLFLGWLIAFVLIERAGSGSFSNGAGRWETLVR